MAKKKIFDVTGLFNDTSTAEKGNGFVIEMIDIDDIETNEINDYPISDIEELAADISFLGVTQNLDVKALDNGKYKILAGERRYTAVRLLVDEHGREDLRLLPCRVSRPLELGFELPDEDKAVWELASTNLHQREQTQEVVALNIKYQNQIFNALKKAKDKMTEEQRKTVETLLGAELKGKRKEFVAQRLGISPRQVQRYDFVEKNLAPELQEGFKSGDVPLTVAVSAAKQEPEVQDEIKKILDSAGEVTAKDVEKAAKVVKAKQKQPEKAPDTAEDAELIKAWGNDESRKAFIQKYETWSVDVEVSKYDMTYYKYVLPDGSYILAMKHNDTAYNPEKGEYGYVKRVWYYLLNENARFIPNTASVTQVCEKLKEMKEYLK